jgi:cytoskeletal protein RodZ
VERSSPRPAPRPVNEIIAEDRDSAPASVIPVVTLPRATEAERPASISANPVVESPKKEEKPVIKDVQTDSAPKSEPIKIEEQKEAEIHKTAQADTVVNTNTPLNQTKYIRPGQVVKLDDGQPIDFSV